MHATLIQYPDQRPTPIERIEVEFEFEGRPTIRVQFRLTGDIERLLLPAPVLEVSRADAIQRHGFALLAWLKVRLRLPIPWAWTPGPPVDTGRADGLWKHTCFEIFVAGTDAAYSEVNISPSGEWAAYDFDGYRAGMRNLASASVEHVSVERVDDTLNLMASVSWQGWMRAKRLGLSAVIEDVDGGKTYWALAHPADKPDFHHGDSFVLPMPTPEQP